jgi:AbiV family abortive infection protein
MAAMALPDLSPEQVIRLQTALLANADALRKASEALVDRAQIGLARSLAILGLEESGKAIAVHRRRTLLVHLPEGESFRCAWLDALWASHEKKLTAVHDFLVAEEYWFAEQPPDPEETKAVLGSIRRWSDRQDKFKQRGFYVELARDGRAMAPSDIDDQSSLRAVLAQIHQIGWQLRLGEHIEGTRQDAQERGAAAADDPDELFPDDPAADSETRGILAGLRASAREAVPGVPLTNAAYRFSSPAPDPFANLNQPGYEAETRELLKLLGDESSPAAPSSES